MTNFVVGGLSRPITQGMLKLVSSDPFLVDDVRYFTVAATPPLEILVVGESDFETNVIRQALAPTELVKLGKARYKVKYRPALKLNDVDFKGCDVVCLVNVDWAEPSGLACWAISSRPAGDCSSLQGAARLAPLL